jgi:hypothetical protein
MAETPEGKVKRKVSAYLKSLQPDCYFEMPVPGGFGKSGLDYSCCYKGLAFYIETKAPDKKPTPRQNQTIAKQRRAGAAVFVIDGDLTELKNWIESTTS